MQHNVKQNQGLDFKTRKGGPYTGVERGKRRNEVYRLHFEYGYSARKISELMKINRNTINKDLEYLYSKIGNSNILNPEHIIISHLERLEVQRSRLREHLDKAEMFQEKMSLERMIFSIDCKIMQVYSNMAESTRRIMDLSTEKVNQWLKDNKIDDRRMTLFDYYSMTESAQEKIIEIIKEDRKRLDS